MELDDLKQVWNNTEPQTHLNPNIMDIIRHKSYGPIEVLKKGFRQQIIFFGIMPLLLLLTNLEDVHSVLTNILFLSYTTFCIISVVFSFYNYRVVEKMEWMDNMVKPNLEQHIQILEGSLRWIIIGLRIGLFYFILLAEIVPYFHHYRLLDYWHTMNPFIRLTTYLILFVLQYFLSRNNNQRKFGDHLLYLKELVKEMQP